MGKETHTELMREAGLEWGLSAAEATLSSIERACPAKGVQPYLLDLDRRIAERAASLVTEGIEQGLACVWERSARDMVGECLAAHDASFEATG